MGRASSPEEAREAAAAIVTTLRGAGHVAYFAGGCVRDELLGLAPTDYDVATDATPDRIKSLFTRTDEVGASFGVVLVTMPAGRGGAGGGGGGKATVEVATFRSDGPYSDRRRPDSVRFSDPESDAKRRDFTVNALFLDPFADAPDLRGRVIDYVGGLADVAARVLRAVGDADARLAEDHLRALRAVRLCAKLSLTLDPATGGAIRRHAGALSGVSRERIGDEVRRIMAHPSRGRAIDLLGELGLDAPVLGGAGAAYGAGAPSRVLGALPPDAAFPTCLGAWAMDRGEERNGKDVARRWSEALCLSNDERSAFAGALDRLATLRGDWASLAVARQKRLAGAPGFDAALLLLEISDPAAGASVRRRVTELGATPGGLAPAALLDGDDLVGMGLKPGPAFKRILDAVYDAQLEGRVSTPLEARELVAKLGV